MMSVAIVDVEGVQRTVCKTLYELYVCGRRGDFLVLIRVRTSGFQYKTTKFTVVI